MERKSEERERSGSISSRTSIDGNRSKKEGKTVEKKKDKKEKKLGKRNYCYTFRGNEIPIFPLRFVFLLQNNEISIFSSSLNIVMTLPMVYLFCI